MFCLLGRSPTGTTLVLALKAVNVKVSKEAGGVNAVALWILPNEPTFTG